MLKLKYFIKKLLASVGLYHPSLGIKISSEAKGKVLLEHIRPEHKVFVETGTYNGDMIARMKPYFEKIYSIELDLTLYQKAVDRFKNDPNIVLLNGDSADEINKVLPELKNPALFWLDAHGRGSITADNSPIIGELYAIFAHPIKEHSILIDDARHFDRDTIRTMKSLANAHGYAFAIKHGIFILNGK
ncbi:MAG: hypothetical protein A3J09_00110 [Candidatus Zambryskibacteria bacterium RIFCSPLOWO2_02_FULL_51_21]|uniref:Methyltransferase FkbM domain-containing protein n=1 Tax=Candidatus Zambryskibacteria bacterium RIFCSPHIGHO2_02_FULL_43_37 TaxID=1802749 RepID=A0A1G2THS2_9BACT|nr:MAG: hypothetical protein A2723_00110 [Candidatus Zambryskibacteria bacterium RIFCSPHIGHO2_01_FULL_52_18]OHA96864.1 MAG: hypothetical protein A3D49_02010 [Candidatus Zambryskibacteria bacterium RIFCSPHIGHO2_02_FULL_43_37]OHB07077.1 MAG: hypothetical protein A2944_02345 [Candidatus Zambryskibacteria bacterium RIFCSPLOWO2_01_FULL_52_12]OHB10976.1 MAG: hypothetical protein A3J09_00110 [Candidatus Zambryskibacteria bacterium RIFCSPLOWO2_02_FULL_51_21]